MKTPTLLSLTGLIAAIVTPSLSFAWGERGHHVICEAATRLVKEPGLKAFIAKRGHMMGHLCNVADIHWRDLKVSTPEQKRALKLGDSSHFINAEKTGLKIQDIPTNLSQLVDMRSADALDKIENYGSIWWRAHQFYRNASTQAKRAADSLTASASGPQLAQVPQDYTDSVYQMMVSMGLMGHFVGDASMPYHNTANYDGWDNGHGGIHSYFESASVDVIPFTLIHHVHSGGSKLQFSPGKPIDVIEAMKELSVSAYVRIPEVEAIDKKLIKESSRIETGADGKTKRIPAVRHGVEIGGKRFSKIIVAQMARSAALLARFWDEAYAQGGRPDLSKYRSYAYPLAPDFVALDYVPAPAAVTTSSEKH